jgi:hypothetical protein
LRSFGELGVAEKELAQANMEARGTTVLGNDR